MALVDHGCWHDPRGFEMSASFRRRHRQFTRRMQWNVLAPWMERAIRRLREADGPALPPATSPLARRR